MGGQGAELSIIFGNFVELCSRRESHPTRCRLYSELSQLHTSFVFAVGSVLVPDFRLFLEGEQPLDRELETLIYNAYSRKCSPPRDWTGTPLPTNVREVNLTLAYRSTVTSKFMSKYRWIQIGFEGPSRPAVPAEAFPFNATPATLDRSRINCR